MHAGRQLYVLILLAVTACPAPPRPPASRPAAKPTRITILTLNDFHGQLDPVWLRSAERPPRRFRVGGAAALAATIAELRRANPGATLLVDAGDFMQGSLLSNRFEGAPVRELYTQLGVDAATIGNHEFDYGPLGPAAAPPGDPRGALKAWAAAAPFPLLSANIALPPGARPWTNVAPSVIVERAGVRVGLVGLTTRDTPRTTLVTNVADLRFEPLLPALRRELARLRAAGADALVLIGHLDGQCEAPRRPEGCQGELFELLDALRPGELDVAVAGHAHRCFWHRRPNGILTVEACSRGVAVGRVELTLHPGRHVAARSRAQPPAIACHDVFADTGDCEGLRRSGPPRGPLRESPLLAKHRRVVADARRLVARYRARAPELDRVVFELPRRLEHRWGGRSEVGQLFAEAMRRAVTGAEVGLINAGGVRGPLPAGEVSFGTLYQTFPFDNRLATVRLAGDELLALLRACIERPNAGLPSTAGLRLKVNCERPPRLVAATDDRGRPLVRERTYLVVLSDFMLGNRRLAGVLGKVAAARKRILRRPVREVVTTELGRGVPALPAEALRRVGPSCRAPAAGQAPRSICR